MMWDEVFYLFIDGGYLRKVQEELFDAVFQGTQSLDFNLVKIVKRNPHVLARRTFYYDCIDNLPRKVGDVDESPEQVEARVKIEEERLERIDAVPGIEVREGYLAKRRNRGRVQKQVDVLLTVDMFDNAVRKNMTTAVLIAGDADFVPVVQAVKAHGTYVMLFAEPKSVATSLRRTADEYHPINFEQLCNWSMELQGDPQRFMKTFPKRMEINSQNYQRDSRGANFFKRGFVVRDGINYDVSESKSGQGGTFYVANAKGGAVAYSHQTDLEIARRLAVVHEGQVTWHADGS